MEIPAQTFRNRHPSALCRRASGVPGAAIALVACLGGCAGLTERPELYPDKWAPQAVDREWSPPPATASQYVMANTTRRSGPHASAIVGTTQGYDLARLIDIALRNNPRTRRAWQAARAAAANFGAAQAPYYPQAAVESDNGYERTMLELVGKAGTVKQWQADPVVAMTWTLLDFGRRRSASDSARARLIAANFSFNRSIQDVVFNTQTAFYALDAANAAVIAAQQNLKLAETDFDAVQQRVNLGLATEPERLLAKERVAQSRFDLANARLLVHDAEAQLAVALGVPADSPLKIQGLENQTVPETLNGAVETLIADARRRRPDLAARVANLRASEAEVSQAWAQFFPVVGLSTTYGENLWNFTFYTPRTTQTGRPQYSAMVSLKWDLFTGFRRLNDVRRAEANREVARAELKSLEIDAVAQVWRAYFEFDSSHSKYDYAESLLAATQESYDANIETYREGLSTIVELLTAERDLANARYTLIQSKAELLTAYAAVAYAAGATRIP